MVLFDKAIFFKFVMSTYSLPVGQTFKCFRNFPPWRFFCRARSYPDNMNKKLKCIGTLKFPLNPPRAKNFARFFSTPPLAHTNRYFHNTLILEDDLIYLQQILTPTFLTNISRVIFLDNRRTISTSRIKLPTPLLKKSSKSSAIDRFVQPSPENACISSVGLCTTKSKAVRQAE